VLLLLLLLRVASALICPGRNNADDYLSRATL
jgi:hypothetical protein